ncbi:MAG: FAD-binding oxidoreductase [Ardenticatenaceae bacterium]|nr:FAD-binding oxidoreductase [Ardenticatenaceae bacterium]
MIEHLEALTEVVGAEQVNTEPVALEAGAIQGVRPAALVAAAAEAEVSAVLALASERGLAVVPFGAGTRQGLGSPPGTARPLIRLDLGRLDRILAYEPADLTATVQAGVTLGALQAHLAEAGQWLPLDPPRAGGATLGGLVAAADSGPHRLRYGTPRDLLIGFRAVLADGLAFSGGAKVVKNVAGYDLPKLMSGSLGTLAVLTELTFKLQPRPIAIASIAAECPTLESACDAARSLLNSPLRPVACEWLPPAIWHGEPGPAGATVLVARFFDAPTPLARALRDATAFCRTAGAAHVATVEGPSEAARWQALADGPAGLAAADEVLVKVTVLPAKLPAAIAAAEAHGARNWQARAGTGLLFATLPALPAAVTSLRTAAEALGGTLVVQAAPLKLKTPELVWGSPRSDFGLMRAFKQRFDPAGLLNPGRFFGGL